MSSSPLADLPDRTDDSPPRWTSDHPWYSAVSLPPAVARAARQRRMVDLAAIWLRAGSPPDRTPERWRRCEGSVSIEETRRSLDATHRDLFHQDYRGGPLKAVPELAEHYGRFAFDDASLAQDEGIVYFLQCQSTGLVKIGMSRSIDRVRRLRRMSPTTLDLLLTMPGSYATERALHERFADARSHGEWFRPSASILEFVSGLQEGVKA